MNNFSLEERARYAPESISHDELVGLLAEIDAWRSIGDSESPEEVAKRICDLEEQAGQCNNQEHSNFDDYKEFFDDCVRTLEDERGNWPCAEPWDMNLRSVILEAIEKGASQED